MPVFNPVPPQTSVQGSTWSLTASFTYDTNTGTYTGLVTYAPAAAVPLVVTESGGTGSVALSNYYPDVGSFAVDVTITSSRDVVGDLSFVVSVANALPVVAPVSTMSSVEGSSLTLPDMPFTDAGVLDTHTASISWGDGSPDSSPTVNAATRVVVGSSTPHDFVEVGSYTVTVTVTDNHGGSGSQSFVVSVADAAPVVSMIADIALEVDTSFTLSDIPFTDAGVLDTHTASISWGDGSPDSVPVVNAATRVVVGSSTPHTYSSSGPFTVTVTVTDNHGGSGSQSFVINVSSLSLSLGPVPTVDGFEGSQVVVAPVAFIDSTGATVPVYVATVSWGDGVQSPCTVDSASQLVMVPPHTYVDIGVYSASLSLRETTTNMMSQTPFTAMILNVAPTVLPIARQLVLLPQAASLEVAFTDPGLLDTHSAAITWGDGTSDWVAITPGARSFTTLHTFVRVGVFSVTVAVSDNHGGQGQGYALISVVSGVLSISAGGGYNTPQGSPVEFNAVPFQTLANVTQAQVSFGDSSPSPTRATHGSVVLPIDSTQQQSIPSVQYTYYVPGVYFARYDLYVSGNVYLGSTFASVQVTNVPPSFSLTTLSASTTEQAQLLISPLSFTDPGLYDQHSIATNWGDGTARLANPLPVGTRTITDLAHTYSMRGTYTALVSLSDNYGGSSTLKYTISVSNAPPTILPTMPIFFLYGDYVSVNISVRDPSPNESYQATITWQDGASAPMTVTVVPGGALLMATHYYSPLEHKPYTVDTFDALVTVTDSASNQAVGSQVIIGSDVPKPPSGLPAAPQPMQLCMLNGQALLSNDRTVIAITFQSTVITSSKTSSTPTMVDCSTLFDTTTLKLLGSAPVCEWLAPLAMQVIQASDSQAQAGSILRFVQRFQQLPTARPDQYCLVLQGPSSPQAPTAVLVAPSTIDPCAQQLLLDGSMSQPNSLGGLTYRWALVSSSPSDLTTVANGRTSSQLAYSTSMAVSIPLTGYTPATTLTIRLTVQNQWGLSDSATATVAIQSTNGVELAINSPGKVVLYNSRVATFVAQGGAVCGINCTELSVVPTWRLTLQGTDTIVYSPRSADSFVLSIPAFTMQPSRWYTLTLETLSNGVRYTAPSVQIFAVGGDLVPLIDGGSRTVPIDETIALDGSKSQYGQAPARNASVGFVWQFWRADNRTPLSVFKCCQDPVCSIVNVNPRTFESDQVVVQLTLVSQDVTKTTEIMLTVVPVPESIECAASSSQVQIISVSGGLNGANDNVLLASCGSLQTDIEWSSPDAPLGLFAESLVNDYLVLPGISKRARSTLTIVLTCANGQASVEITYPDPIATGTFTVTPAIGSAYNTSFTLAAPYWFEPQYAVGSVDGIATSLLYDFGYIDERTGEDVSLLAELQYASTTQSILPAGQLPGNQLRVWVHVIASNGYRARATQTITVFPYILPLDGVATFTSNYTKQLQCAQTLQDAPRSLVLVQTAVQSLEILRSSTGYNDAAQVSNLVGIVTDGTCDDAVFELRLHVLTDVASNTELLHESDYAQILGSLQRVAACLPQGSEETVLWTLSATMELFTSTSSGAQARLGVTFRSTLDLVVAHRSVGRVCGENVPDIQTTNIQLSNRIST